MISSRWSNLGSCFGGGLGRKKKKGSGRLETGGDVFCFGSPAVSAAVGALASEGEDHRLWQAARTSPGRIADCFECIGLLFAIR